MSNDERRKEVNLDRSIFMLQESTENMASHEERVAEMPVGDVERIAWCKAELAKLAMDPLNPGMYATDAGWNRAKDLEFTIGCCEVRLRRAATAANPAKLLMKDGTII